MIDKIADKIAGVKSPIEKYFWQLIIAITSISTALIFVENRENVNTAIVSEKRINVEKLRGDEFKELYLKEKQRGDTLSKYFYINQVLNQVKR